MPVLRILDPIAWRETTTLIEGEPYAFDASGTMDDSLLHPGDNVNLTYRWDFGDGTFLGPGKGGAPDFLLNVTHIYPRWGYGYPFELTVRDASDELGWLRRTVVVEANSTAHPDIAIVPGTLLVEPPRPEAGTSVHIRVGFRNQLGRAAADDLRVTLAIVSQGMDRNQTGIQGLRFLDADGNDVGSLPPDRNATVEFTWTVPERIAEYSLVVRVYDGNEPPSWINVANAHGFRLEVTVPFVRWSLLGAIVLVLATAVAVSALLAGLRRLNRRDAE